MHIKKYILLLASVLLVVACSNDDFTHQEQTQDGPVKVGFWMGRGDSENTRTFINDDGQTISWEAEDKVALWAQKDNTYIFQNQTFDTWFVAAETNQAFFTTTLPEAMPEGTYTYYACYPLPQSVSEGTKATFTLPATQDGKMGGGADIMVAQGEGPALAKLYIPEEDVSEGQEPDYVLDQNRLSLRMRHLIHALRFYVPQAKWGFPEGETVERIVFTMPQSVAGTVTTDVSSENGGLTLTSNESNSITLSLDESLTASASRENGVVDYDYAVAAIIPPSTTYGANDMLEVTAYSQKRFVTQQISLSGRGPQASDEKMRMAAGSVTPVGLDWSNPSNPKISFRIKSNNLGEEPYRITLESANTYAKWNENSNYVYVYDTGSENKTIADGDGFEFYSDFESISTIWGNKVKVTYESKSAIVTQTIDLPEMELKANYIVDLDVPYLFAENFDGWANNTSHWEKTENSLSTINDWSGNQWRTNGTNMGLCSYVGDYGNFFGEYATDLYYGRLDSPIIPLKKEVQVKLEISFDLSMEDGASNGNTGCIYGFSTSTKVGGYSASSVSGHNRNTPDIPVGTEITYDGSSYSGSIKGNYTFDNTPENLRLTWFADINRTRLNISSKWFKVYIDNVRVKIVQ